MKTRILSLVAALLLAGCGSFQSIDKDHNKQCKENCNVYDAAATPPPDVDVDVDVVVEPAPVVVQPAQPVVVEKQVVVEKPVYVEKPIYIEKPAAAPQTASINGYLNGKKHGRWVERIKSDAGTAEGPYINGRRHGHWVLKSPDGYSEEGPFVDGERHGKWIAESAHGSVLETYVNGVTHGMAIWRRANGDVWEIPYKHGKEHGNQVVRYADGRLQETPFVNGKKHGLQIDWLADGSVHSKTPFVNGKEHGLATLSSRGLVVESLYKDGVLQELIRRYDNGGVVKITGELPDIFDEKYRGEGAADWDAEYQAWENSKQIIAVGSEPDIEDEKYSGKGGFGKWADDHDNWRELKEHWEKQQDAALASGETDAGN